MVLTALLLLLLLLVAPVSFSVAHGVARLLPPAPRYEPPPIYVYALPARFNDDLLLIRGREEGDPPWLDPVRSAPGQRRSANL